MIRDIINTEMGGGVDLGADDMDGGDIEGMGDEDPTTGDMSADEPAAEVTREGAAAAGAAEAEGEERPSATEASTGRREADVRVLNLQEIGMRTRHAVRCRMASMSFISAGPSVCRP